ncbi:MAG: FTR1 family protein [Gemmatimonadales bacterium]|nr:FTR1 family protein [Gemmatimonadales bacterium]
MILIGGILSFLLPAAGLAPLQQASQSDDVAPHARRVAATAQLAAQEYRIGVVDGKVVAPAEVEEARLFLAEALRSAQALPRHARAPATAALDSVIQLVHGRADPDTIAARVRTLSSGISERLGVSLDEVPAVAPSLARGAEVYRAECAGCHGMVGGGDGPMASGLDPAPADLTDRQALSDQSPLDYFRRISIGVVGTAMPAFEHRLPPDDRWAVALYSTILRLPAPAGEVPPALRSFATSGKMSDLELLDALNAAATEGPARVAAIRAVQAGPDGAAGAEVLELVRNQLNSTYALARLGDPSAGTSAFDAYMTFEQVERSVRAQNPALATELEEAFAALRAHIAGGASPAGLAALSTRLATGLERAERTLSDGLSPLNLFIQSFVIMLREGLEAILIVGALMTFLVKTGAGHRRRDVNIGVGAAVVASLLTALALETIFRITPASQEALEGVTMILATVVLFYVSYWLLSKMEVVKWNHFVKSKVQHAVTSGSALALASAAFLAVYREGFETVLFYKALFLAGGTSGGTMSVVAGMLVGSVVLVGVYLGIHRFGVRLPLKPFFGFTSAFLYFMAFVFAGNGVAELQEGGVVSTTIVSWAPRLPSLGIYPTIESLAVQGVLVLLLLVALVWTFAIGPRRQRRAAVRVPEPRAELERPLEQTPR